jgi:uncharacterized protein YqjF (DUF2071 family)
MTAPVKRFVPVHPVPMCTVFRHCFLANFAIRPDVLATRLPSHLRPAVHEGWSFLSIVIAEMERMRPAFLPRALGITYSQVVYRAVVTCGDERGVYFLRSDADNGLMVAAGNALTFFRFHRSDMTWSLGNDVIRFVLRPRDGDRAAIDAEYDLRAGSTTMPKSSRFRSLDGAQQFLTELYVAFGAKRVGGAIDAVRIRRNVWQSVVVTDRIANYEAMSAGTLFGAGEAELDSWFYVEQMNYHWFRGTTVRAVCT